MPTALGLGTSQIFRYRPAGGADPIAALFANGEDGTWRDPSDLSTMGKNADGTGAVSVGDSVRYVGDKSGNNRHWTIAPTARAPILRQTAGGFYYLEHDGVDDYLETPGFVAGSDDRFCIAAVEFPGIMPDSFDQIIYSLGGNVSALGDAWNVMAGAGGLVIRVGGNKTFDATLSVNTPAIVTTYWGTSLGATSASAVARLDGTVLGTASESPQTIDTNGGFAEGHVTAARIQSGITNNHSSAKFYGFVLSKALYTTAQIENAEAAFAARYGVTLA